MRLGRDGEDKTVWFCNTLWYLDLISHNQWYEMLKGTTNRQLSWIMEIARHRMWEAGRL